jgi:hypothetical protein
MNGKVYLARFTNKSTGEVDFYKFGHTRNYDAAERFKVDPDQYSKWDIKIMKTVYGPIDEMKGIEETFKVFYPKNLFIEEKISGVTEIVKLEREQVNDIIAHMDRLNQKYFNKRERERSE